MDTSNTNRERRSSRLGFRATVEQEVMLRKAAAIANTSLTDFILHASCLAAEQTLLDQRLFMASGEQYEAFLKLLDAPPAPNTGIEELFAKPAPWNKA